MTPRPGMNARWLATRSYPPLQRLLQTGHHYAIWDDHDYGPDNSDRGFALKSTSLELFRRYWANGSYGLPDAPGIFSKVSYEDVDIFLLDDRFHRDDDSAPDTPRKTMLGHGATRLAQARTAAVARQLQADRQRQPHAVGAAIGRTSAAARAGTTIRRSGGAFLEWLAARRIDGVVFLSGDIHYSHLTERERPGHYPLVELTCSPLTSRVHPRPNPIGIVRRDAGAGSQLLHPRFQRPAAVARTPAVGMERRRQALVGEALSGGAIGPGAAH